MTQVIRMVKQILPLLLIFALSGCAHLTECKLYDGPEQPLGDLAMIYTQSECFLVSIDGKETNLWDIFFGAIGEIGKAYYVLPGQHEMCVGYGSCSGNVQTVAQPITLSKQFEPGYTYQIHADVQIPFGPTPLVDVRGTWNAWIDKQCTVEHFIAKQSILSVNPKRDFHKLPQRWKKFLSTRTLSLREYICLTPPPSPSKDTYHPDPNQQSPQWRRFLRFVKAAYSNEILWKGYDKGVDDVTAGNYDLSIVKTSALINRDSATAELYIDRGVAYARKGLFENAIEDFNTTLTLQPDFALAYYNRGVTYYKVKKFNSGTVDLRKVLELQPQNRIADLAKIAIKNVPKQ